MKTFNGKLNKESEKAINVTFTYNESEITTWLPKSSAKFENGIISVKENFWSHKKLELMPKIIAYICTICKETEKAVCVEGIAENVHVEREWKVSAWFPKSQIEILENNEVRIPAWLFLAKTKDIMEDNYGKAHNVDIFYKKEIF